LIYNDAKNVTLSYLIGATFFRHLILEMIDLPILITLTKVAIASTLTTLDIPSTQLNEVRSLLSSNDNLVTVHRTIKLPSVSPCRCRLNRRSGRPQ
jgi:hypothetical protein